MSDNEPRRPASDPVHHEAEDWAAAGLPEQEDTTEDTVLPGQEPVPIGEEGAGGTEREAGESHDAALARERPDVGGDAGPAVDGRPERADEEETEPGVDRPEAREGPGVEGAAVMDTSETGTLGDAPAGSVRQDGAGGVGPTEETPSTTARLVEPDEGTRPDTEKDLVARDAGRDEGAPSAEDAAVRVTPERATDDEPPG